MAGPKSQSQYTTQAVPLDGGLDLINPKITLQAGTVQSCLNMERTDRVGYSRIFGMERFDGGMAPSLSYTNLAYIIHETNLTPGDPREEIFILQDDDSNGPVLGCVVDAGATKTLIAVTNFDEWRQVLRAVQGITPITINTKTNGAMVVTDVQDFNAGYAESQLPAITDASTLTFGRNVFFQEMRDEVGSPGDDQKPVIGLHGFKDQVYAVKDLCTIYFSGGNSEIFSNDTIHKHGDVTADNDRRVLDVHLLTGTYAGGDATGVLLIDDPAPPNGVYDINRVTTPEDSALTVATAPGGTDMSVWAAGMYRSASYEQSVDLGIDEGWSKVELGFATEFDAGQSNGPFRVARRGTFSNFSTDVIASSGTGTTGSTSDSTFSAVPVPGDTWDLIGAGTVVDCVKTNDLSAYIRRTINNDDPNAGYIPGNIYLSNFPAFSGFSSASSLEVQGVEVTVVARPIRLNSDLPRTFQIAVQPVVGDTTLQPGSFAQTQNLVVDYGAPPAQQAVQTLTFGGPTDLFGMDAATIKSGMDSGWGFAVQPWVSRNSDGRFGVIDVIFVQVTVHYTANITQYYFWNGADDVTANITSYFLADGDWETNDAEGTIQVTNVEAVGGGNRTYITDNDEIRTDPNGGGLLVATINGDMTFNGLDTLDEIETVKSRYQFITENFYATEDFEGMYGVSGAGRAFSWDGFYFTRIYTQEDSSKDIPRHITSHQFHLTLGYGAGANLLSVAGNPLDFTGVNGAVEIDTGDGIVGYAKMSGTTLGIFCKKTIQGLVGTSIDNFSLTILSPYEGAIEYSVADCGKPVYTSYRGISIFDQTAAYGDFAGQRMSYLVTPFLIPRIQGTVAPLDGIATSKGLLVALACRTKNQYRLHFADGYRLTMTLVGAEQQPQFSIQAPQIHTNLAVFEGYFVPRAETSFVDSTGAERVIMAPYSKSVDVEAYHVYEFEKSWTFDGSGIPSYFVTNENFYGTLFDFDNVRKIRLHGLSFGYAPITIHTSTDYDLNDNTEQVAREAPEFNLPRAPASTLYSDYVPVTNKDDISARGRSFSMRVMSYILTGQLDNLKDPVFALISPPFVIQAMMVQYTENKGDT